MIGFSGVGKSSLLSLIEDIPVIHIDAQEYADERNIHLLIYRLNSHSAIMLKQPVIILIDELDKIREINQNTKDESGPEKTSAFIGALNQILSSGSLSMGYQKSKVDLSHVMVVTTMNLPPEVIQEFSDSSKINNKSFYDYSAQDFAKFYDWATSETNAISKILSKMFRSNTVGRLASNTLLMQHFSEQDYRDIIKLVINDVIKQYKTKKELSLDVDYDEKSLIDFFYHHFLSPSLGARGISSHVYDKMEQLIQIALRYDMTKSENLRPRKVFVSNDGKNFILKIESLKKQASKLVVSKEASIQISIDPLTQNLVRPENLVLKAPEVSHQNKKISASLVRKTRYPTNSYDLNKLISLVSKDVYEQEEFLNDLKVKLQRYLSFENTTEREPVATVVAGFSGIGKSAIIDSVSKHLKLPVARINMQNFSTEEGDSVSKFLDTLEVEISRAKSSPEYQGKYILSLEELDKLFELDPSNGSPKNRPVLTVVKDLLDFGKSTISIKNDWQVSEKLVDVRDAFLYISMNFNSELIHFEADPRLTTIEDVMHAYEKLASSKATLREVFSKIFRPDTINRLLSKVRVLKPLSLVAYQKILNKQVKNVVVERFGGEEAFANSKIKLELSKDYLDMLFSESVIPSEGGRYAQETAKQIISRDFDFALRQIPNKHRSEPVKIKFHFDKKQSEVVASFVFDSDKKTKIQTDSSKSQNRDFKKTFSVKQSRVLSFPPVSLPASALIEDDRLLTAVHEFGHAYMAVLLGLRLETMAVVSPSANIGGYAKFQTTGLSEAQILIANIYISIASRAFERIFLSEQPKSKYALSFVTSGASVDIQSATRLIRDYVFKLGFTQSLGVLDFEGGSVDQNKFYAKFQEIPFEQQAALAKTALQLENKIIDFILKDKNLEWYKSKIEQVARKGILNEAEFMQIIDVDVSQEPKSVLQNRLHQVFAGSIKASNSNAANAFYVPNADQNLKLFSNYFVRTLEKNLSHSLSANQCASAFKK